MVSHEERKQERMGILSRSIKAAGKDLNREKLIAMCEVEWGMARRTILEYLKAIETYNDKQ